MINSVFLLGTIASEIEVPFSDKEHQAVSAVCVCGKRVRMAVPIAPMVPRVAWGKAAEVLGDLAEGDTLVVEGKLRWVKRGKSGVLEYGLAGPSHTACWSRGNPVRAPISLTSSTPKRITGATGQLYTTVTLACCRRCSGSHWGSSGRHAADGAEISSCLDCARPSPETLPVPGADDRDEYACPSCHDFYSWVKEARSTICFRCRPRF